MLNYVEPYLKDNNLLQLSLFYFGHKKKKETKIEWSDSQGKYALKCVCEYGVPGSFENDVYSSCMRIWVKQGMPCGGIHLNYSDICRELRLDPKSWVGRIKKALRRLGMARYEFIECFIVATESGNKKITTYFSLFDSMSLFEYSKGKSKKSSISKLLFPYEIRQNLEAKYYQYLDLVWYRALPEGLPRRLYEYLAKKYYQSINGQFRISEQALCRWLPILDKHTTNRRKRIAVTANSLVKANFLKHYYFDVRTTTCVFTYALDISAKSSFVEKNSVSHSSCNKEENILSEKTYCKAIKWLNSIPYFHNKRKDEIIDLGVSHIVHCYPGIKDEYDRIKNSGKTPKAGWVYKAFIDGWTFSKEIENEEKIVKEKEMQDRIEKLRKKQLKVINFIGANGGENRLLYKGEKFIVIGNHGIEIVSANVLEHWHQVDLNDFEIVE